MTARRSPVPRVDTCTLLSSTPEVMVFDALEQLARGEQLCVMVEHEPFGLYRHLSDRACAYCTRVLANTMYEVTIWRCGTAVTA